MAIANNYTLQPVSEPVIRTRDRTMRTAIIPHIAVSTITSFPGGAGTSVNFQEKLDIGANEIALSEMGVPTKFDGVAVLYAADAGSGLTKIMARFWTGADREVAVETP